MKAEVMERYNTGGQLLKGDIKNQESKQLINKIGLET